MTTLVQGSRPVQASAPSWVSSLTAGVSAVFKYWTDVRHEMRQVAHDAKLSPRARRLVRADY